MQKYAVKKVPVNHFNEIGIVADYYPSISKGKYGVMVVGGSEGGKPTPLAEKIASLGYSVLSLAYFKDDDHHLPEALEMIPLEYFNTAKKWFLKKEEIRQDGLVVIGWSKGAELALVLSSMDSRYKGVVAIAPSSVVWQGILNNWNRVPSSSWSVANKPIPYVPFEYVHGKQMVDMYTMSLKKYAHIDTTIDFQKIIVPVLLLSGGQDAVWPSNVMAQEIVEQIRNYSSKEGLCIHYNYHNAGHLLDEQYDLGGNHIDNQKANVDSLGKIEDFLNTLHL